MSKDCLEIGVIQAFIDGETTPQQAYDISEHIAACDACALTLAQAEEESSFVMAAVGREVDSLVPTQRLWTRINASIEEEKTRVPFWQKAFAMFSLQLAGPSMAAAGVLVILGGMAVIWSVRSIGTNDLVVSGPTVQQTQPAPRSNPAPTLASAGPSQEAAVNKSDEPDKVIPPRAPQVQNASYTPRSTPRAQRASGNAPATAMTLRYIPGEESYIRTIDELKQNVDYQKDRVLPPATRIAFERDLAVVNDSIDRMQKVVRKDPNNRSARQVLYAAYQDKIDLLNSVAQRGELMASLR